MKMRIQGNILRFRLNRREVDDFDAAGRVGSAIVFPGGQRLAYALIKGGGEIGAGFDGAEIQIRVPEAAAEEWARTDIAGLTHRAGELEIVIEKDFQCMHKGEGAKDPDAYPNPMAG